MTTSGPLFKTVAKMAKAAAVNFDLTEINKFKDLLFKIVTDPAYAKLADDFLIQTENALGSLNSLARRIGQDETAGLLKRVGGKQAKLVMDTLASVGPNLLESLKSAGKLDIVANAIVKADWRKAYIEKYAAAVSSLGADSTVIRKFDEFIDSKGSGKLLTAGVDNAGVQAELAVAKKFKSAGDNVVEFRAKPKGADGDIDVVTANRVIEVKSGNLANEDVGDFAGQLAGLKTQAGGKTPVLAIPSAQTIPQEHQKAIDALGITVERFD